MKILFLILLFSLGLFATSAQESEIRSAIMKKFQQAYPTMQIDHLKIGPVSSLYRKLGDYRVSDVTLTPDDLKRSRGNAMVTFTRGAKKRKLYFKYRLGAEITLYTAATDLQRGRAITPETVLQKTLPFTTLYHKPITEEAFYHYVARRTIKADTILSPDKLKKRTDIQRNDKVNARISDGGVSLSFEATALQAGNVGDIIKIRKDYKRRFKARVLSNTQVEVLQ
jgi:flagella basal body P-ring formation protein FlgA